MYICSLDPIPGQLPMHAQLCTCTLSKQSTSLIHTYTPAAAQDPGLMGRSLIRDQSDMAEANINAS